MPNDKTGKEGQNVQGNQKTRPAAANFGFRVYLPHNSHVLAVISPRR